MPVKATACLPNGFASPPYQKLHSGPVIVAGNAWCLGSDLERAREIYGQDTPVIAINGASREVKAFALYSGHCDRFVANGHEWIRHQRRLFGDDFTVHSASKDLNTRENCPFVDYWWTGTGVARGTSAWAARKLAHFMGFNLVILCGSPLVCGSYSGYRPGLQMTRPDVMRRYCKIIKSEPEWHKGCLSASGWTAKTLGTF